MGCGRAALARSSAAWTHFPSPWCPLSGPVPTRGGLVKGLVGRENLPPDSWRFANSSFCYIFLRSVDSPHLHLGPLPPCCPCPQCSSTCRHRRGRGTHPRPRLDPAAPRGPPAVAPQSPLSIRPPGRWADTLSCPSLPTFWHPPCSERLWGEPPSAPSLLLCHWAPCLLSFIANHSIFTDRSGISGCGQ